MIYLDNAATTFPKPTGVILAMDTFMKKYAANPGRSGHRLSLAAAEEIYACREEVAELFNAPGAECVAFTMNATQALNFALKGELLKKSSIQPHVITSDLEHNSVIRPICKMSKDGAITYSVATVDLEDDKITLENFKNLINSKTRMIACTHASNVCGKLLPIKELGKLCKQYGLKFLVDASQSAGIVNIDMKENNIDYLCMPGHKSLYGPMGTGILVANACEGLNTIIEGGTGSNSVDFEQPNFLPDMMEAGTANAPGIVGLRKGIVFAKKMLNSNSYKKEMANAILLYDKLSEIEGVKLYTQRPVEGFVPVVSFNIANMGSGDVAKRLDSMDFALRGGIHCAPLTHLKFKTSPDGMVRASFGAFNTPNEALKLAWAVDKIQKNSKLDKK